MEGGGAGGWVWPVNRSNRDGEDVVGVATLLIISSRGGKLGIKVVMRRSDTE